MSPRKKQLIGYWVSLLDNIALRQNTPISLGMGVLTSALYEFKLTQMSG